MGGSDSEDRGTSSSSMSIGPIQPVNTPSSGASSLRPASSSTQESSDSDIPDDGILLGLPPNNSPSSGVSSVRPASTPYESSDEANDGILPRSEGSGESEHEMRRAPSTPNEISAALIELANAIPVCDVPESVLIELRRVLATISTTNFPRKPKENQQLKGSKRIAECLKVRKLMSESSGVSFGKNKIT